MDPFAPEGILPNVLRWAGRPGQAVRNILHGNPAAAGRQLLDFAGEGVDAFLPGDLIPQATSKDDYLSGSEFIGLDKNANPWAKTAADIGVELATDPLSYLSFGLTGAAKAAAAAGKPVLKPSYGVNVGVPFMGSTERAIPGLDAFAKPVDPLSLAMRGTDTVITKGAEKLDALRSSPTVAGTQQTGALKSYQNIKDTIRRAAGAEDLTPQVRKDLEAAGGVGSQAARLYSEQAQGVLKGLPQDERVLLGKAFYGVDLGSLNPKVKGTAVPLSGNLMVDVDALAKKYGKDSAKLQAVAKQIDDIGKAQFDEAVTANSMYAGPGRDSYLARQWILDNEDVLGREMARGGGKPNSLKDTALLTPSDRADFFNKGDVGVELDPAKLLIDRAQQQGEMLKRTQLAKTYGGTGNLTDDLTSTALKSIESDVKAGKLTSDDGHRLATALSGMPPRTGLFKSLAGANRVVKGAMVFGVLLPKVGSLVRNKIGMGFQAAATPNVRGEALKLVDPRAIVNDLSRAFDEAYGEVIHGSKSWARSDELGKDLTIIDDAFRNAKQTKDVDAYLKNAGRGDLADALNNGVLDGLVSTEELVKKIAASPNKKVWTDLYRAPAIMFQHMEQRGRLQTFKNLRKVHGSAEAAKLTKEAMFDYEISSTANRNLRDVIPFAQFAAKSIPQSAKWLSTKPAVAAAAGPLFYDSSGENDPIYPYMSGQSRVNLGPQDNGNNLYLTGFGLPMESLNMVPNLSGSITESGRSISHGLLSSTQPLIKTGAAVVTGKDPYFGTPFGSYSKLPIVGEAGDVGRYANMVLGTGIGDVAGAGILRQIGQATDETKPGIARAIDLATGAKLVSVDPDVSARQQISNYLDSRPDISQYKTYYQGGEQDPEFTSLMQALREAKARSKEKKLAAAQAQ